MFPPFVVNSHDIGLWLTRVFFVFWLSIARKATKIETIAIPPMAKKDKRTCPQVTQTNIVSAHSVNSSIKNLERAMDVDKEQPRHTFEGGSAQSKFASILTQLMTALTLAAFSLVCVG